MSRQAVLWGVGAAFLLAQGVRAQEREPAAPVIEDLKVTAERDDPRRFSNAATLTVPHEELTKYGDSNLQEAIRRIPGVTFDGSEIRFRGLGSGYTQILINGDPAPLGFAFDSLSPDSVERIEIYKTPVAELSTAAIAGSINIVLREKARQRHLAAKTGVTYSQGNKSPSLTLEASDTYRDFSFQVTGTASKEMQTLSSHIEEISSAAGVLTAHRLISQAFDSKNITYNLTPVLSWKRAGDKVTWQPFAQRLQYPFLSDLNEQLLEGVPSDYPYSRSQARSPTRDLYKSNLTWTHEFSADRSLESRLNLSFQRRDSNFYFDGYDPDGELALDRNVVVQGIDRTLVWKEKYVQQLNSQHALAAGWDGSLTRRTESRLQIDRQPLAEPMVDTLDQDYDARIVQKALYAQDEWTVSPVLSAYLGVRLELTETTVGGADFTRVHNDTTIISPIAQLVWKLPYNQKDQIRLGFAHTTRPPTTFELVPRRRTANADNGPTNPDAQGNPYLKPERAWGLDAAYESYLHDGGLVTVSAYARHVDDVMVPILFTDGSEWVASTANDGTAKTYGTALEFKLPLQRLLNLSSQLQVKGDVSANWSRVSNVPGPNNRLADQTPLSADLGLEYEAAGALSGGVSIRYTSGYSTRDTLDAGSHYGATQSLDLYGAWQINPATRLRLSVDNALHRNEVYGSYYMDPAIASSRVTTGDQGVKVRLGFEIGL